MQYIILFITLFWLSFSLQEKYIYITFHGKNGSDIDVNNIYKYKLDGTFVGPVLNNKDVELLRGMIITNENKLLIANSYKKDSKLMILDNICGGTAKLWVKSDNLEHPYGLVQHNDGNIYVSNQDLNTVVGFTSNTNYTSITYNIPAPRGIAITHNKLYAASKQNNCIMIFDLISSRYIGPIQVHIPIGVTIVNDIIYVGSSKDNVVYAFDSETHKQVQVFRTPNSALDHPAGMSVDGDILYVLGQANKQVLRFNIRTGGYLGKLIQNLPDRPENLIIVNC